MNTRSLLPAGRRDELKKLASRSNEVILFAGLTGAATGLVVALFELLVVDGMVDHLLDLPLGVLAVVPGVGLLVALFARRVIGRGTSTATADEYLHAFHDPHHVLGFRDLAARMIAAVATLGCGAPMGLEGPSLYAGATLGSNLQRRFPRVFRDSDHRTLLVAGAAAGVAAIFKAPATGAVFALEVPYRDDLARRMLLPSLVASATGYLTFAAIHGTKPLFPIEGTSGFELTDILGAIAIGMVAGLGARLFAKALVAAKALAAGRHQVLNAAAAGVALAAFFAVGRVLTGESLTIGSGYSVINWATSAQRSIPLLLSLLVLRSIATATTVAGGGVGGLFIPLVVAGALSGSAIGNAINPADHTFFVVIGVAAFLGAGYRVPLAAIIFVAETTGRPSFIVPGLLAAVAAEFMMGGASVTKYQQSGEFIRSRSINDGGL